MIVTNSSTIADDKITLLAMAAKRNGFKSPDLQYALVSDRLAATQSIIRSLESTMFKYLGLNNGIVKPPSIRFKDHEVDAGLSFVQEHLGQLERMLFADHLSLIQLEDKILELLESKSEKEIKQAIKDNSSRAQLLEDIFRLSRYNFLGREQAFDTLQDRAGEAKAALQVLQANQKQRQEASEKAERSNRTIHQTKQDRDRKQHELDQVFADTYRSDDAASEALNRIDTPALYENIDPARFDPHLVELIDSHKSWFLSFNDAVLAV